MKKQFLAGACAILFVASPQHTHRGRARSHAANVGTIYYVSANGNDTTGRPNDPAKPYRSPRGAYAQIPADITSGVGDHVVELTDGTVYGQLDMTPKKTDAGHRLVLRAAAGMRPTMDAHSTADGSPGGLETNPAVRVRADYAVVQGVRFNNTSRDSSIAPDVEVMLRLDGSNVWIEGNYFDGLGRASTPNDIFLIVCGTASDNVIAGNRFDFSGGKGLIYVGRACGGVSVRRLLIRNNVLSRFGNKPNLVCAAINFGGTAGTLAGDNSIVENNTIYDNGGHCYGLLDTDGAALTVRNNIFSKITGNRSAVGCEGIGGVSSGVASNSLMFGNSRDVDGACGTGGWTLSAVESEDPYFVAPDASPPDLHVESTSGSRRNGSSMWVIDTHCSAAIDKAAVIDAFDKEPLPHGGRRNLGAYGNTPEASKSCRRLATPIGAR